MSDDISQRNFYVRFFALQDESNLVHNITYHDQSSRGVILGQMVSQTIWQLSDSIIIQWKPQYLNETINKMLESIDIKFQDTKGIPQL